MWVTDIIEWEIPSFKMCSVCTPTPTDVELENSRFFHILGLTQIFPV